MLLIPIAATKDGSYHHHHILTYLAAPPYDDPFVADVLSPPKRAKAILHKVDVALGVFEQSYYQSRN